MRCLALFIQASPVGPQQDFTIRKGEVGIDSSHFFLLWKWGQHGSTTIRPVYFGNREKWSPKHLQRHTLTSHGSLYIIYIYISISVVLLSHAGPERMLATPHNGSIHTHIYICIHTHKHTRIYIYIIYIYAYSIWGFP